MTNEQKKQIIQREIEGIKQEMYPLEVRARVSKKVGDNELNKRVMAELEKLEKYLDAYGQELDAIKD